MKVAVPVTAPGADGFTLEVFTMSPSVFPAGALPFASNEGWGEVLGSTLMFSVRIMVAAGVTIRVMVNVTIRVRVTG